MAIHAHADLRSPYRGAASLAELLPPDRRRRNAVLFGLSCAMMGGLLAWSVETLATWEPEPGGWSAIRGRAFESPARARTLTEPAPELLTFSTLTALDSKGTPPGVVDAWPSALDGQSLLTVICFPACEDVTLDGASLGASPVWQNLIAPGTHRLGLRFGRTVMRFELRAAPDEFTMLKQAESAVVE